MATTHSHFHKLFSITLVLAIGLTTIACKEDPSGGGTGGTAGMAGATGGVAGMTGGMAGMAGMTGGMGGMGPTYAPTWNAIFTEIIVGKGCNGGAFCHAGAAGGNLIMPDKDTAYTALVGVAAMGTNLVMGPPECNVSGLTRVVAGDPDASLLMQKIASTTAPCGTVMPPPPAQPLSAQEIMQIRTWIMNGAHND